MDQYKFKLFVPYIKVVCDTILSIVEVLIQRTLIGEPSLPGSTVKAGQLCYINVVVVGIIKQL